MSQLKEKRRHPDLIWPHSPGFVPLAEQAIDKAADLPGEMIQDAVLEAVCPESVLMLLEIKGTAEQLTAVTTALKSAGLIVNIVPQHHYEEDED